MNLPKLKTNIPRTGTITAVWYAKSKQENYKDQIKVVGRWESEGEGPMWLPLPVVYQLAEKGLVRQAAQPDSDGYPAFEVVAPQQRVLFLREEDGTKKYTNVYPVDAAGQPVTLAPQPKPVLQVSTPAPATPAPPVPTTPVAPPAPGAPPVASAPPSAARAVPADPTALKESARKAWAQLDERYACALAIAGHRLAEALTCRPTALDPAVLQAAAATILIEAGKQGLMTVPGLAPGLLRRFHGELPAPARKATTSATPTPAAVGAAIDDHFDAEGEDDDLPF